MTSTKTLWCAPLLLALAACQPQQGPVPDATSVTANAVSTLAPNDGAPDARVGTPVPARSTVAAAPTTAPAAVLPATAAATPVPPPEPPQAAVQPRAVAPQPAAQTVRTQAARVAVMGEVRAIEPIRERPPGTGKGAVIGGVLGGVVGNQFGHGNGRAAMTVLGAAGGAVAGNNIERNMNKRIVGYRVSVRLDNGQARTFTEPRLDGLRVGDRVRVDGKHVRRA